MCEVGCKYTSFMNSGSAIGIIAAVVGAGVPFVKMRTETLAHRRKSIHSSVGKGLRPNDSSAWGTFALDLPLGRPKTQFLSHENRERL